MVILAEATLLCVVPMAVAVAAPAWIHVSLFAVFDRITLLIPCACAAVAVASLRTNKPFSWQFPLAIAVLAFTTAVGMAIESLLWRTGFGAFGFHPIGIAFVFLLGFLFLLHALLRWKIIHRQDLIDRGICTHCGYDLRATPHRCPECGAVPSSRSIHRQTP